MTFFRWYVTMGINYGPTTRRRFAAFIVFVISTALHLFFHFTLHPSLGHSPSLA